MLAKTFLSLSPILALALSQRVLQNEVIGGTSKFGQFSGDTEFFGNFERILQDDWNQIWEQADVVPAKVPDFPDGRLMIRFPSGVMVRPNDTFTPGLTLQFPRLLWDAEPNQLYSLMMVDIDIFRPDSDLENFFHYFAINIPGTDVDGGDVIYPYIPPFYFDYMPGRGLDVQSTGSHRIVFLVFRQQGRLELQGQEELCSPAIFQRLQNYIGIVRENNLGNPVAGNFLRSSYTETANQFLCVFTKCTGEPFPAPLPGINDGPECQP